MKKVTLFATVVAASMLAGGVTAYTIGQVAGNDTRTYTPAAFGEQAGNHFTSYEADKYPDLTPKERENAFVKENGTTFLMKIGAPLKRSNRAVTAVSAEEADSIRSSNSSASRRAVSNNPSNRSSSGAAGRASSSVPTDTSSRTIMWWKTPPK